MRTRHAHLPPRRSPPEDAAAPAASAFEASDASFSALGAHLDDAGNLVFARSALGTCGPGTVLAGSSIVTADDRAQARQLATDRPLLVDGGGVEVDEITVVVGSDAPGAG